MQATDTIFYIVILIMSVVIHEVSHGFMAECFGDTTARYAGRLTLNPLAHLDIFGSIILPIVLFISTKATGHPFVFGWAKPVPYNPDNLSDKKWGTIAVASAGVLANFCIAIIFGIIIRLIPFLALSFNFSSSLILNLYSITSIIVLVNLALGIFNLVPIPPLDGSKILFSFLPYQYSGAIRAFEQYSLFLLLIFIVFFSDFLAPIMGYLFHFITGLAF